MPKSKVYFVHTKGTKHEDSLIDRIGTLWNKEEVDLKDWINPNDIVVIKTHFGSRNQTRHLRPMYIRKIVDLVRDAKGIPWVAEGVGLGWDEDNKEYTMANGPGFLNVANRHGFNHGSVNAPVIMDDGLFGTDVYHVKNEKGKYIKNVALAMGLRLADKVLVVSRFKGHDGAGFGGALKQLGIGCVGKEGKGGAHFGGGENIYIKHPENCRKCDQCIEICPVDALSYNDEGTIQHNSEKCIACIMCFSKCHHDIPKEEMDEKRIFALRRQVPNIEQVERMMDNAAGAVKGIGEENIRYINIAIDITSHCDCATAGGSLMVPDIGVFYSTDPVAIDQACADKVEEAPGLPDSPMDTGLESPHGTIEADEELMESGKQKLGHYSRFVDPDSRPIIAEKQIAHAYNLGMGSREYELVEVLEEEKEE